MLIKKKISEDFGRAAVSYAEEAGLQRRVAQNLAGGVVHRFPSEAWLADLGCGTGFVGEALRGARKDLRIINFDIALPMAEMASNVNHGPAAVGDIEQLPFASGRLDGLVSSLSMQWLPDLSLALAEAARVLKPGGLAAFSTFLPGTLAELGESFTVSGAPERVLKLLPEAHWHAVGAQAGLSMLEARQEEMHLYFEDVRRFFAWLRAIGAGQKELPPAGRDLLQRVESYYAKHFTHPEGIRASWHVLYMVWEKP